MAAEADSGQVSGPRSGGGQALLVRGAVKAFNAVPVLRGVDLTVRAGETHALLGENGAGKSTLIKCLAGVHPLDSGHVEVAGQTLRPRHAAAEANTAGLQVVHQDVGLVDGLDVAENLALTIGYSRRGPFVDHPSTRRRAAEILQRLDVRIDPRTLVGELTPAEKVMVAVARAFSTEASVIVLDEVTASLPTPEVRRLERLLEEAKRHGTSFLFVTHRLAEVFDMADRVTVLRDGLVAASSSVGETTRDELVTSLVGRELAAVERTVPAPTTDRPVLVVEDLRVRPSDAPISFSIGSGEVLAVAGLIGSGAADLARIVAGAQKPASGRATFGDAAYQLGDPVAAVLAGCRYVCGDRAENLAPDLTVRENLFLGRVHERTEHSRLRAHRTGADEMIAAFDVRPGHCREMPVAALSGGNQQKVIVGRALTSRPGLLVLDDPTSGVDVGARAAIHQLVREAVAAGVPVLLASTDFSEVATEAHRALVFAERRLVAEIAYADLAEHRLVEASQNLRATA